ncbi:MAG: hypothetical protein Kow00107_08220 [Planctomycetota bacterium]
MVSANRAGSGRFIKVENEPGTFWLSSAKAGVQLVLVSVDAGRNFSSRLAEMGIFPGVELSVIKNDGGGPVIIEIRGSRVMLGRGEANKVLVKQRSNR